MSLPKKAVTILRQVKRAILAEPELYDQQLVPADSCDTPCCLLGWVVWMDSPSRFDELLRNDASEFEWDEAAIKILGLEDILPNVEDQWRLFGSGCSWPAKFREALYASDTAAERAKAAAARIEHFIATDGAE